MSATSGNIDFDHSGRKAATETLSLSGDVTWPAVTFGCGAWTRLFHLLSHPIFAAQLVI